VAHAEASARTVDAAVTAAATQLGLRPDQVDIEVLEDPVPSTFGYIGTPARVRVTPRGEAGSPGSPSTDEAASGAGPGPGVAPAADATDAPAAAIATPAGTAADAGSAGSVAAQAPADAAAGADAADPGADRQAPAALDASTASPSQVTQVATPSLTTTPTAIPTSTSGLPADVGATTKNDPGGPNLTNSSDSSDHADPSSISGADSVSVVEAGSVADAEPDEPTRPVGTSEPAAALSTPGTPTAPPSSTLGTGGNGDRASDGEAARATSTISGSSAAPEPPSSESSSATRPPRRTYRDEPIEPAMVEADTERAGDFLEGLLDALDVDGDITTWVDEVGGHIDLEGAELDPLVGSNGETLDALQELTRLAVLRRSKRRVRLLLDINGFRARQRDQLVSIVKAMAEQVIRTREDHEFQPMTPAERKIVHDAVAAIDGARTESLGEDPHRRVVIRPA
jgi:spoIIIJ-associated protein